MAEPPPSQASSIFAPFRHRMFLAIWLTNTVSNFGFQIQAVGAAWAMTMMTGSPRLVALVSTAQLLPMMLLSLVFGAVADVFDRRNVLLAAQLIRMAAAATLSALAFAGLLTPALLLGLTFVLGCGLALNQPAAQAAVGELVPQPEVPVAVSLNSMGMNLSRTVAPAAGGVIVASAGAQAAFLINALAYIGLLLVLLAWRRPARDSSTPRETIAAAAIGGLHYVVYARGVGRIVLRAGLSGTAMAALSSLLPLVVRDRLGGDSVTFGIMLGCVGVGAVAGGFARLGLRARLGSEAVLQLAQGLVVIALLATSLSRAVALTGVAQVIYGAGMFLALNSYTVTMQLTVPRWVVGRAMAIVSMGNMGGFAVGAWLWGSLAETMGVFATQQVAAGVMLAAILLGFRLPLLEPDPELHRPAGRQLRIGLADHDGSSPVAVQRDFRIPAEHRDAFLRLMRHRRRMRLGQGVRQWSLTQDVEDAEHWCERYQVSSWEELRRIVERLPIEEQRVLDQIQALDAGGEPARLRMLVERDLVRRPSTVVRPDEEF